MPIRALLIGVDQYHPDSRVLPLAGCCNDVAAMRHFLLQYFRDQIPDETHIQVLENQDATRENVVQIWRKHLCQSQVGDTVLIYFSGHGSRSLTAPEFHKIELDGYEEGWVLHDSRLPGHFDLSDKEIALLLAETAQNNPDIVVISDACHSGSITRDAEDFMGWKFRFTPGSKQARPLETYLNGAYSKQLKTNGQLNVPHTRHLSFSACKNTEKAWESDEKYGAFTNALLAAASHSSAQISYADLFVGVCAEIRQITRQQNPQIATFGGFNPHQGLLGIALPPKNQRRYPVYFNTQVNDWRIKLGVDAGLRANMNQAIPIELFDAPAGGNSAGKAQISQLNITESSLDFGDNQPNRYANYWAIPLTLPLAPLFVFCPDPKTANMVSPFLKQQYETTIVLLNKPEGCPIELRFFEEKYVVYTAGQENPICTVQSSHEAELQALLRVLDQIAYWHRIQALENPASQIPAQSVDLAFHIQQDDGFWKRMPGQDFTLSLEQQRINFKCTASNHSGQDLHCALVYLSPRFGMQVFSENSTSPMAAGTSDYPMLDTFFHLPENTDAELDHFKLIVSTEAIDPTAFSREDLNPHGDPGKFGSQQTRSIGGMSKSDWLTKSIQVRLLRDASDGTVGENIISLAGGQISLQAHPSLRSAYRVTPPAITRGLDAVVLDHPFFRKNPTVQLLPLGAKSRSIGDTYLDLTGIQSDANLNSIPWEIGLQPDDPDILVLPFWFDGANFLPLGETVIQTDGTLGVQVRQIPIETEAARTRSLGKALRLYAFRFAKEKGLPVHTQFLRWVEYDADGNFERREAGLAERVKNAKKITLLLHGIIGDTKTMAEAFQDFGEQPDNLVLSFDYENLKTPIEDTALALKKMLLENARLEGKKIEIVAHSMGGLVARYFLERLNGHSLVERLVMTGTPNAGSKLGDIPDYLNWASGMLGIGMKYFQWNLPAIAGLIGALQFAKKELFITLKQMKPGSKFLTHLNAGAAPSIPYRVIAGDIHQFLKNENDPDFSEKMLAQIGRWAYSSEPNDGAVSVESVCAVAATSKDVVAGHHWGYYAGDLAF